MKLVTVPEMQAVEREANEQGLTYDKMMENAGQGLGNIIASEYDYLETKKVLGLVGSGNNGGDTLVAFNISGKARLGCYSLYCATSTRK